MYAKLEAIIVLIMVRVSVDNAPRTERRERARAQRSAARIKMRDWGLLRDRPIKLISV